MGLWCNDELELFGTEDATIDAYGTKQLTAQNALPLAPRKQPRPGGLGCVAQELWDNGELLAPPGFGRPCGTSRILVFCEAVVGVAVTELSF